MRVSAKADYALRALIEIAVRADGSAVSAEQLGKAQGIPHGFLQAILADLRRADIVLSQVLQHVWIAARSSLRGVFERVSIQDLADGTLPPEVASLTADEDAWQPH